MTDGTLRITRDDVNPSGQTLSGGGFLLTGSVGGADTQLVSAGGFQVTPGLQKVYFYPSTITPGAPAPASSAQIDVTWPAPSAEVTMDQPAASYVVKYSSLTALTDQVSFAGAATFPQGLTPQSPGGLESLSIPGLSANTSYYIGIESLDRDKSASYFSVPVATWTLCNTPSVRADLFTFSANTITLTWDTNNNRPGLPVTYNAQVVTDTTTMAGKRTEQTVSASGGLAAHMFTGMSQGVEYFLRVDAVNGAGVESFWSTPWVSTTIPVGLPIAMPFTGQDVDRVTANWQPNGGIPAGWPNSTDPSFQSNLADNTAYDNPFFATGPSSPQQTLSFQYTGLQPNTTYYAKVRAFPFGGGQASAFSDLGWTMSGVHASVAGAYTEYTTSASFTWSAPPASNGPNTFYYRVEMSTAADFTGTLFSSTVGNLGPLAATVNGLTPNTVYFARLQTLNGLMIPSVSPGPLDLGSKTTHAIDPLPVGFTFVDDYQVELSWSPNGNSNQTRYQVDLTSDTSLPGGNFSLISATTNTLPGATLYRFNKPLELLANTTYFARIRALGSTPSNFALFGSTTTRPTTPSNMTFSGLSISSITVNWSNANANGLAANNTAGTTYLTELRGSPSGSVLQSKASNGLSATFNGLSTNTTYYFSVYAQSAAPNPWPQAGPLTGAVATLADTPAGASPGISAVTASGLTAAWASGTNAAGTDYRVEVSTDDFASVSQSFRGTDVFSHPFTGLLANSTYYARVWAVNHSNLDSASPWVIGSTVTQVNTPDFAGFQVFPSSITILVDDHGNAADTTYRVRDLNAPTKDFMTTLQAADAQHAFPWVTVTPLPINTPRDFRVSALNRVGSETPAFSASTWTLAMPDAAVNIGSNSPITINLTLNPGSNPTASPSNTQFAIRLESVSVDGAPILTHAFVRTPAGVDGSGNPIFLLGDPNESVDDDSHWRTFAQWNNGGVIVSSGMASGRNYQFAVYVRNGDAGSPPRVVSGPGPVVTGRTKSGVPILSLNGVTGIQSQAGLSNPLVNGVWVNTLDVGIIARGAFHNHWELSQNQIPTMIQDDPGPFGHDKFPGWDGEIDRVNPVPFADPANSQGVVPNYQGALSGFRVAQEGRWFLHVIGDSYFPPFFTDHLTETKKADSFVVHVDTTPADPAVMNLQALRHCGDSTAIVPNQQTGWDRPCFAWVDVDAAAPGPLFSISPTVGYSYLFTTDNSQTPALSTDTALNTQSHGFQVGASSTTHKIDAPPITVAGVYYFKVRSLDKAGNWSAPAVYTYNVVPDKTPPVPIVDFGPSVLVAANGTTVAVSTAGVIKVYFTEPMDPNQTDASAFDLRFLRNNMNVVQGSPGVGTPVSISVSYQEVAGSSPTAVITPSGMIAGGQYVLKSTTRLEDESGNVVDPALNARFYTLMNPAVPNVMSCQKTDSAGNPVSVVSFPPSAWDGGYAGLAVNEDPANEPMAAPALSGLIAKANKSLNKNAHGYGAPLAVHEFNLYDPNGLHMSGRFNQPVHLTMRYEDQANDGIVDQVPGVNTNPPVRVSSLAIYWLDDEAGVWVRVPGSVLDPVNHTVEADVRHFSVYGVLGAPAMDLSNAHAFPVPYKPSVHPNGIKFINLSSVATIRVYTVGGELVKTLHYSDTTGDGELTWNPVTNESGSALASDVYIYIIENDQQKKTGKLLVVR